MKGVSEKLYFGHWSIIVNIVQSVQFKGTLAVNLYLAFCSEHLINIKHRILATFNITNNSILTACVPLTAQDKNCYSNLHSYRTYWYSICFNTLEDLHLNRAMLMYDQNKEVLSHFMLIQDWSIV